MHLRSPADGRFHRRVAHYIHPREAEPGTRLTLRVAGEPAAAAAARGALCAIREQVEGSLIDDLRLLVSELVTNSVRHSGTAPAPVGLDVAVLPGKVRVEVTDEGDGFDPEPPAPQDELGSGFGLYLVDRLADRWGVVREDVTRVWLEIDRRPQPVG